jgi:L,D-transpeptidase catalytic domain
VIHLSALRRTSKQAYAASTALIGAGLAALIGALTIQSTSANSERGTERAEISRSRPAGAPLLAIVALNQQRVTIYDAGGSMLRSPVSTGQTGYETPAGIYSVIEKEIEHSSNLYDGASMPFMQRITWSGIALHAGVLPGYPASHGCIRLPHQFAKRLFELTNLGMRVIIMRDDVLPAAFTHPLLFKPSFGDGGPGESFRSIAAAKSAEAQVAANKAEELRPSAATTTLEVARLEKALRLAEAAKARVETGLREAERLVKVSTAPAALERAQGAKIKALAALELAQQQVETLEASAQRARDLAVRLREEAKAAEVWKVTALEQAKEAMRKLLPISVFISRKTQRLYVRQAFQPLFESPVTIIDPDRPLGTFVFTALAYTNDEADLRWSAVSMYKGPSAAAAVLSDEHRRDDGGDKADVDGAKSGLDRISIPKEVIDRISEVVSPGSALIISDEGISTETRKAADFVILMSGEPQGGLKMRRRQLEVRNRPERPLNRASSSWSQFLWSQ